MYPGDTYKNPHHHVTITIVPGLLPYQRVSDVITRYFTLTDFSDLLGTTPTSTFIRFEAGE